MILETAMEGQAVETRDGLIFTVKGLTHPKDRVIAYLRYLPSENGNRVRHNRRYQRVYAFAMQTAVLKAGYPGYLTHDPCLGIQVQSVPRDRICRVYDPFDTLARLMTASDPDPLEQAAREFAQLICQTARIPLDSIGISGSVMLGLHTPDSDLDYIVRGKTACIKVHAALGRLLDRPARNRVARLNRAGMKALHASHMPDTPICFDRFKMLQDRKVNEGTFQGIPFFVRFVPAPEEVDEQYGDPVFTPLGQALIQARILDDQDRIFSPCRYQIRDVVTTCPGMEGKISEIVSFRGRFSDQARTGEMILARGQVEAVVAGSGATRWRLNLGGTPGDFMEISDGPGQARDHGAVRRANV